MSVINSKLTSCWSRGASHAFLNPYSYFQIRNSTEILDAVDRILIDGQLLVFLLKILGVADLQRRSFDMTSLASEVFLSAIENKEKVYLVGSTQDDIKKAAGSISTRFPGINIQKYHHGYIGDGEGMKILIEDVLEKRPTLVVVGMGSPLQEFFLYSLRESGWLGTAFTCGGFFHQAASAIDYYPNWADKFNLRWLYRLMDEPRLVKRYFLQYPLAILLVVWDFKVSFYFQRLKKIFS